MAKKKDEAEKTGEPGSPGEATASVADGQGAPSSTGEQKASPIDEGATVAGDPAVSDASESGEPSGSVSDDESDDSHEAKQCRPVSDNPTPVEIEAATPKPGESLVGDSVLTCLADNCGHEALSADFPTTPLGSNHAWTCPICGSTEIDTTQIARVWALKGPRVFPFGNDNTIG